jgi:rod shape determining protein RodA
MVGSFIKDKIRHVDPWLFGATTLLSLISAVVLFGARNSQYGSMRNLIMQVGMTVLGMIFMIVISNLDLSNLSPLFYIIVLGGSLLFIALLWTPLGESAGENRNWMKIPGIGISVQPSEFVRFSFILTFSKHLSLIKDQINRPKNVLLLMLHAGIIFIPLLLSGDLGMVLVYVGIMAVMLYCAGLSLWYFLGAIIALVAAFPFLWELLAEYQKKRILVGFNPDIDPLGKGLQQIQSRTAIAGGGFFGRGLDGAGSYKGMYGCLTDFFFSTYAEMFGLFGCLILLATLITVVVRLIILARRSSNPFGALVCAGVAGMVVVQTLENIGMCLCLLPVVGITLPFLSAGGSSVLSIYLIFGLVHGTVREKRKLL